MFINSLGWAKDTVFLFLQCFESHINDANLLCGVALPLKLFNCESLFCRTYLLMSDHVFFPCRSIVEYTYDMVQESGGTRGSTSQLQEPCREA